MPFGVFYTLLFFVQLCQIPEAARPCISCVPEQGFRCAFRFLILLSAKLVVGYGIRLRICPFLPSLSFLKERASETLTPAFCHEADHRHPQTNIILYKYDTFVMERQRLQRNDCICARKTMRKASCTPYASGEWERREPRA